MKTIQILKVLLGLSSVSVVFSELDILVVNELIFLKPGKLNRTYIGLGNRSRDGLVVLIGVGKPFMDILDSVKIFWDHPFQLMMLLM